MSQTEKRISDPKYLWKSTKEEIKNDTCLKQKTSGSSDLICRSSSVDDNLKNIEVRTDILDEIFIESEANNNKHGKVEFGEKVTFSAASIKGDIATMKEVFGFYAPPINKKKFEGPIESFSLVKELPSRSDSKLITISKNIITIENDYVVNVIPSKAIDDDFHEECWEVTEGSNLKLLNVQPYVPLKGSNEPILSPVSEPTQQNDQKNKVVHSDGICTEFLSHASTAEYLVTNTIYIAECENQRRVLQYGDGTQKSYNEIIQNQKVYSYWPLIKDFTKKRGSMCIDRYIKEKSHFFEDWKYNIVFDSRYYDNLSDHYIYEVKFGLPTKIYPIPQVTASIYFLMEVSRVLPSQCPIKVTLTVETSRRKMDPKKFILRDNILLKILDEKLVNFRRLTF